MPAAGLMGEGEVKLRGVMAPGVPREPPEPDESTHHQLCGCPRRPGQRRCGPRRTAWPTPSGCWVPSGWSEHRRRQKELSQVRAERAGRWGEVVAPGLHSGGGAMARGPGCSRRAPWKAAQHPGHQGRGAKRAVRSGGGGAGEGHGTGAMVVPGSEAIVKGVSICAQTRTMDASPRRLRLRAVPVSDGAFTPQPPRRHRRRHLVAAACCTRSGGNGHR